MVNKSKKFGNLENFDFNAAIRRMAAKNIENMEFVRTRLHILISRSNSWKSRAEFVDQLHDFYLECDSIKIKDLPRNHEMKIDETRISQFIGSHKNFSETDFKIIVFFLAYQKLLFIDNKGVEIETDFPDPLFHALLSFMKVGDFTLAHMKSRTPGLYRAYRPASTFPGNYWVGVLMISINTESGAINTNEFYQSNCFDNRPNKIVEFEGYLIRKGRHYSIISRDESVASLVAAFLPYITVNYGRISTMAGGSLEMNSGKLHASKVYYERVDTNYTIENHETKVTIETPDKSEQLKQKLFADSSIRTPEQIPKSILNFFLEAEPPSSTTF